MDKAEIRNNIIKEVHTKPLFEKYNESNVRNNTNCYSHALGSTFPYLKAYRIGAICSKKPITEEYRSIEEIKKLLFLDCEAIQLKIEESSLEEELLEGQFKIALFVEKWSNGRINDYHFFRFDNGIWTEKRKREPMVVVEDLKENKVNYYPWNLGGFYKITK